MLNTVALQSQNTQWLEIVWHPQHCSMSFHGRDIFAPIAAKLAVNQADDSLLPFERNDLCDWSQDLAEVIYFDHYGNAMTGLRYREDFIGKVLNINGIVIRQADTFSDVGALQAFWYQNSSGLVEIAVNKGRAEQQLALRLGMRVGFSSIF